MPTEPASKSDEIVFVCYSHSDEVQVRAEIDWLRSQGFQVWFDDNIRGGAQWNDELAHRIQHCAWFLYFVSPASVVSPHCRNELNYAQQTGRRMLAIELEPTEMPAGLQLMLNARQFLFRHKLAADPFHQRLLDALGDEADPEFAVHAAPAAQPGRKRRNRLGLGLAAAALILIAALVALWPRPETKQTIEFKERDWVVVGNLQNRTGDAQLGEALESGLRIALEQSKFASILPAATMRAAKQRMKLDPDAPLEREAAIELAQREDARVSIVGDISKVGGSFTINVEMIDPGSGATVSASSVRADTIDDLLPAIDEISRQVRERLGESLSSIVSSSMPLAKVTTSNFEALRAYSLAEKSVATGDWEAGLDLLEKALEIDPEFAMAHGKMAAIYIAWARQPELASAHYELALQNKSRLSQREQVYIEASSAWLKTPAEMRSAWKSMSVLFPNEGVGFNNLGEVLRRYFLDCEAAAVEYRASSERRAPWQHLAFYNLAQCQLALGNPDAALKTFMTSFEMSGNPVDFGIANTYTVLRRYEEAREFLARANPADAPNLRRISQFSELWLLADRGELAAARQLAERMLAEATVASDLARIHASHVALLEREGERSALRSALKQALAFELEQLELGSDFTDRPVLTHLAILARVATRNGISDLPNEAIAQVRTRLAGNEFPVDQAWLELLEAEILLQQGEAEKALERAQRSIKHAELFQAHETLSRVHQALGDEASKTRELEWMRDQRGLAFVEDFDWFYGQAFNVLDWSRANQALGQP